MVVQRSVRSGACSPSWQASCKRPPPPPRLPSSPAEGLGLSEEEARAALLAFPAYITYSLPGRIAPRAAAATALAGTSLPLGQLALGDDAFARWLGVDAGQYHEWQAEWRRSSDAAQWLEAGDEEAG